MKAVCIVGSARSDGSTAYLVDTIRKGMESVGIETVRYSIVEANLHFCTGCKTCYEDGNCIWKVDVETIVSDLFDADFVVIAAPSYWAEVPGQLKVFFDRSTPYGDTNPSRRLWRKKPAKGIAIAVRAGSHEEENVQILNSIAHYYGHLGIETVERVSVCRVDTLKDLLSGHQEEIDRVYRIGAGLLEG